MKSAAFSSGVNGGTGFFPTAQIRSPVASASFTSGVVDSVKPITPIVPSGTYRSSIPSAPGPNCKLNAPVALGTDAAASSRRAFFADGSLLGPAFATGSILNEAIVALVEKESI